MYCIVELWGSCNGEYYNTVDWVVTSCGLVDGYHFLGGRKGDTTPTTASVPVYQFTPCHSVGDCETSTVILFFHDFVWHSALSFDLVAHCFRLDEKSEFSSSSPPPPPLPLSLVSVSVQTCSNTLSCHSIFSGIQFPRHGLLRCLVWACSCELFMTFLFLVIFSPILIIFSSFETVRLLISFHKLGPEILLTNFSLAVSLLYIWALLKAWLSHPSQQLLLYETLCILVLWKIGVLYGALFIYLYIYIYLFVSSGCHAVSLG